LLAIASVLLEPITDEIHQFWNAGQVPISIGYLGMAQVRAQPEHCVLDGLTSFTPALHAPNGECVP
jgi:hypothetical protein